MATIRKLLDKYGVPLEVKCRNKNINPYTVLEDDGKLCRIVEHRPALIELPPFGDYYTEFAHPIYEKKYGRSELTHFQYALCEDGKRRTATVTSNDEGFPIPAEVRVWDSKSRKCYNVLGFVMKEVTDEYIDYKFFANRSGKN